MKEKRFTPRMSPAKHHAFDKRNRRLLLMSDEGLSIRRIAEATGLGRGAVESGLRWARMERRQNDRPSCSAPRLHDSWLDEYGRLLDPGLLPTKEIERAYLLNKVHSMRRDGRLVSQIAKAAGFSATSIRNWLWQWFPSFRDQGAGPGALRLKRRNKDRFQEE
jgi:transposase